MANYEDEVFRPEGNQRKETKDKNSGCNIFLIIFAVVGGLCLLCCCGIGITMYTMVPEINDNPAIAQETLDEIMTIELLEGYTPKLSGSMNILTAVSVKGVVAQSDDDQGVIIVGQFSGSLAGNQDFVKEFQKGLMDESGQEDIIVEESETRSFDIDGQATDFIFIKGRSRNGTAVEIDGDFEIGEAEPIDKVEEMIEKANEGVDPPAENEQPAEDEEPAEGDQPADGEDTAVAENAADGEADADQQDGVAVRQVKAVLTKGDKKYMFLLSTSEENWDEEATIEMIESISLK